MPLHERWALYPRKEINAIKEKVCIKHKCPYTKKINDYTGHSTSINYIFCDYLAYTGHSRGCLPEECTHWQDTGVPKRHKREFTHHRGGKP